MLDLKVKVQKFEMKKNTAPSWARTSDLPVNSRALYLLSYESLMLLVWHPNCYLRSRKTREETYMVVKLRRYSSWLCDKLLLVKIWNWHKKKSQIRKLIGVELTRREVIRLCLAWKKYKVMANKLKQTNLREAHTGHLLSYDVNDSAALLLLFLALAAGCNVFTG